MKLTADSKNKILVVSNFNYRFQFYFSIIFSSIIFCCSSEERTQSLKGHWHCLSDTLFSYDGSTIHSIDIVDSLIYFNKYQLGPSLYPWPYRSVSGKILLPDFRFNPTDQFSINKDSLFIGNTHIVKFVKSDVNQCELSHCYSNDIGIDLDLENGKSDLLYHTIEFPKSDFQFSSLIIGPRRSNQLGFNDIINNSDSMSIQANDVFIDLKDIEPFCLEEVSKLDRSDMGKLCFILHCSKDVPSQFIKKIETHIPIKFPIYRAVNDKNRLGLKLIRKGEI